ncbi:hypothetical protein [Streptomyces sp. NPDC086182]|jgi:hypothetical protein|uniref:hypothetical protein n=1 Tax=Streptomyces sp. NPDC086182 TaxID=3155058 RepID=UPI003438B645
MNRATTAVLAATLLLATGCVSSTDDPAPLASVAPQPATGKAACKAAIKAQYEPGTAKLKGEPGTPPECDGLSTDEVSKIAISVIEENTR